MAGCSLKVLKASETEDLVQLLVFHVDGQILCIFKFKGFYILACCADRTT
jgi:hypothetical protein